MHIKTMKQGRITMRIFLMCLLAILSLGACKDTKAKDTLKQSEKSYKATTVDECINEKECVWYAFSHMLGMDNSDFSFFKWDRPLRVHVAGQFDTDSRYDLANVLDLYSKILPVEVNVDKTFNLLVLFSDDYDQDIYQTYKKDFDNALGDKFDLAFGKKFKERYIDKSHKCRSSHITLSEPAKRVISFLFVPASEQYRQFCLEYEFLSSLGFMGSIPDFEYSILARSLSIQHGTSSVTDLDKFVVSIVYDSRFLNGMKRKEIQKIFYNNYNEFLTNYKKGEVK